MPENDPLIGERINNYIIIERIGAGGMGVIYKATHDTLGTEAAIKFLSGQFATNEAYVARFLREARAAASLNHPNIISVQDAGSVDNIYYMIMEFVDGQNLSQLLRQRKVLTEDEVFSHGLTTARALGYAHQQHIIHRDIKPENLMLKTDGVLKVADLGLAKMLDDTDSSLTSTGTVMGTPYYISPEQIRGDKNVDPRTDIYSLGATMFHLATGQVPFSAESSGEIMAKHLTDPPPLPRAVNPKLGDDYCRIHYKMMAKDRNDRYRSMEELAAAIEKAQTRGSPRFGQLMIPSAPAVIAEAPEVEQNEPQYAPTAEQPKARLKLKAREEGAPAEMHPDRRLHPAVMPDLAESAPKKPRRPDAEEEIPRGFLGGLYHEIRVWCKGRTWQLRLPIMLYCMYAYARQVNDPGYASFLQWLNITIHQWGHGLFSSADQNLHIAGGTILQVAIPLVLMFTALFVRRFFAYTFFMGWFGMNLVVVGAYLADARGMGEMTRLSGDEFSAGEDDPGQGAGVHDWQFLLGQMDVKASALVVKKVGMLLRFAGYGTIALSLLLGAWLLIEMLRSERASGQK